MDIVIKSDGTRKGTTLSVNGVEIQDLRDFGFYMYSWDNDVSFNYETREEDTDRNLVVTKNFRYDPCCASAKASGNPMIAEVNEEKKNLDFEDFDKM